MLSYSRQSNGRAKPSGGVSLGTVREEEGRSAAGAQLGYLNLLGWDPSCQDGLAIQLPEVQPRTTGPISADSTWPLPELLCHFFAYLVTAWPDRRPNANKKSGRLGTEAFSQGVDGSASGAPQGAAPAGVDSRDGPPLRMDHQEGYAVGKSQGEQPAGAVRHLDVGGRQRCGGVEGIGHDEHVISVYLPTANHPRRVHSQSSGEAPPILQHAGRLVGNGQAEVERVVGRRADSAEAGGDAVCDVGGGESGKPEDVLFADAVYHPRYAVTGSVTSSRALLNSRRRYQSGTPVETRDQGRRSADGSSAPT